MKDRNEGTKAQAAQIKAIEKLYGRTVDRWTGDRGYDGPDQDVTLVDFERQPGERPVSVNIKTWMGDKPDAELVSWENLNGRGSPKTWLN